MHTHASMPVYNKLHHFTVRVCKVSAHLKVQICSSTLAVKLYSRSVASLTVKLCYRPCLQRSLECARSKVWSVLEASTALEASHCRSFDPFEWVEASIHSQFFNFCRNRSTVLASLRRADVSVTSPGGHCRKNGVKSCSNGALISPNGEVGAV